MPRTKVSAQQRDKKIRKVVQDTWPFLVAAGLVNSGNQRRQLQEIAVVLGHKTVLLPSRTITTTRYLRRGQRYVLLKSGEPFATVDLPPTPKGRRMLYHITYGPLVSPLYKTLQWLTTEHHVPEMKITALVAMHLGRNFLYDERMKTRKLYEVADIVPPMRVLTKDLERMHNKMFVFLEKEHRKFRNALRRKLKKTAVASPGKLQ